MQKKCVEFCMLKPAIKIAASLARAWSSENPKRRQTPCETNFSAYYAHKLSLYSASLHIALTNWAAAQISAYLKSSNMQWPFMWSKGNNLLARCHPDCPLVGWLADVTVFRNLIRFPNPLASWQEWYFKEKGENHISKGGRFQRVAWDSPPWHMIMLKTWCASMILVMTSNGMICINDTAFDERLGV